MRILAVARNLPERSRVRLRIGQREPDYPLVRRLAWRAGYAFEPRQELWLRSVGACGPQCCASREDNAAIGCPGCVADLEIAHPPVVAVQQRISPQRRIQFSRTRPAQQQHFGAPTVQICDLDERKWNRDGNSLPT